MLTSFCRLPVILLSLRGWKGTVKASLGYTVSLRKEQEKYTVLLKGGMLSKEMHGPEGKKLKLHTQPEGQSSTGLSSLQPGHLTVILYDRYLNTYMKRKTQPNSFGRTSIIIKTQAQHPSSKQRSLYPTASQTHRRKSGKPSTLKAQSWVEWENHV